MALLDPSTSEPLPEDAIQRVLFVANTVHVYNIPPLTSIKGHSASTWTADPARHIFTARLRLIETASPQCHLKVDVVLEDPSTGQLFAAAPYADPSAVEPVVDSSRFFALTVRDPLGRKATLGIGFEERSDAFDLAVALQEARRALGMESQSRAAGAGEKAAAPAKDYSLKEGETITVNIGKKMGRRREQGDGDGDEGVAKDSKPLQSFALAPPPPAGAGDVKRKRRSLKDLGFDDGQFGEFS